MMKMTKYVKLLIIFVIMHKVSFAQPLGNRVVDISFYLDSDMQPGYTLCETGTYQRVTDSILSEGCFTSTKPTIIVKDKSKKITFHYTLDNHLKLILYKNDKTMNIHFGGETDFTMLSKRFDLGKIQFQEGIFLINNTTIKLIKNFDFVNWGNYRLHQFDSLHYYYFIKKEGTNSLIKSCIYTTDFRLKKEIYYFADDMINLINIEHYYDDYSKKIFSKTHHKNFQPFPKTYNTCNEYIEIDSGGIIKNRVILERLSPTYDCRFGKTYQQKQQIGKHYTEIQNTLPVSIYKEFSRSEKVYDDFITSPIINRTPYAIQISNVGYFPQDTLDLNKFKAITNDIVLKVTFSSGADKIGQPIIRKRKNGNEILYEIYLIETKASYEMEWIREVLIPLQITPNDICKINFPLVGSQDLLDSIEYDYSPRWILLGLNDQNNKTESPPIIIYGSNIIVGK